MHSPVGAFPGISIACLPVSTDAAPELCNAVPAAPKRLPQEHAGIAMLFEDLLTR